MEVTLKPIFKKHFPEVYHHPQLDFFFFNCGKIHIQLNLSSIHLNV